MTDSLSIAKGLRSAFAKIASTPCGSRLTDMRLIDLCLRLVDSDVPLYQHPLGFVQFEAPGLFDVHPPYDRARIHFFQNNYDSKCTSPSIAHSHNWRLKSLIALGEISNIVYEFVRSEFGRACMAEIAYRLPTLADIRVMEPLGDLIMTSKQIVGPGQIYCQEPELLHSTIINSDWAVTFVLAETTAVTARAVFESAGQVASSNLRRVLTHDERAQLYKDLLDANRAGVPVNP